MKIAFVVSAFPKLSETFILNQITGLIDRGHEVDIYADSISHETKIHPDVEGYNLLAKTCYFYKSTSQRSRIFNGARLTLSNLHKNPVLLLNSWNQSKYDKHKLFLRTMLPHMAARLLHKPSYDIIHCHFGWNGLKGLLLRDLGLLSGKLITTFHGYDLTAYLLKYNEQVYKDLLFRGDLFLPISDRFKTRLIELGTKKEKAIVHHMGIDCCKFSFRPRYLNADQKIQLVTVARFVEKKGVGYAIHAVAKLVKTNPNIEYNIIGDGSLRENLQQLISELGVKNSVKLLGWKRREEVIELLNQSHIFLAPSVTSKEGDQEGIPVGLMEAMAMGLPIVSTQHSGIPELVKNGASGLLVPEKDVEALANSLTYLIQHPEAWEKMGRIGRSHVEQFYNIDKLNDQLVELYRNLLAHSKTRVM